ncbi:phosphoribosylanthranilate isomerase [Lientehia hominis]
MDRYKAGGEDVEKTDGVKVKICGLRRPEDIQMANRLKPDFIGFVFAKSSRQVDRNTAERLKALLDPEIRAVGVFVDEEPERVAGLCRGGVIDMVQLHGEEDREYMERLRNMTCVPVIRAVRVKSREQVLSAERLPCDYLLLDAYTEGIYGGSGKAFDRELIPSLRKPYFLAGGLRTESVAEAVCRYRPYGVDASSSLESGGYKDIKKVEAFLKAARGGYAADGRAGRRTGGKEL